MGTRADFYIGRGEKAEWLGSIAWDGYPGGLEDTHILDCIDEHGFRAVLEKVISQRQDWTAPKDGWPWPWDNGHLTDYSYAFDEGKVWATSFGHGWFDPLKSEPEDEGEEEAPKVPFPNMKSRQKVTFGKRSGVMIFGVSKKKDV